MRWLGRSWLWHGVTGSALLLLMARPLAFLCASRHLTLAQIKLADPRAATIESKTYYHK